MANENAPSAPPSGEAQPAAGSGQPDPTAAGTPVDPTRELELRIRGLDAKVGQLQKERDDARKEATDLRSGVINAQDASKAEVETVKQENARLQALLNAATLSSKYPKAAQALKNSIGAVSEDELADLEATLGAAVETPAAPAAAPNPKPVPNTPPNAGLDDLTKMSSNQLAQALGSAIGDWNV